MVYFHLKNNLFDEYTMKQGPDFKENLADFMLVLSMAIIQNNQNAINFLVKFIDKNFVNLSLQEKQIIQIEKQIKLKNPFNVAQETKRYVNDVFQSIKKCGII